MKTSFSEILDQNKLVIPILQRDYAQGRTDVKTSRIRSDFLKALFDVLENRINASSLKQNLELDFVYGFSKRENNISSFSPIDGQQRLTTLWLLWWFVAAKEQIKQRDLLANFRYETRHSTTVFCEKLVKFNPLFDSPGIAEEIKNQPWYFETWDYDPGIRAMLVTLNEVEIYYNHLKVISLWEILNSQNSPFYFYKLDMEKVGLPDDLYIKMNSRGKPLTDFEYFKANFSEVFLDEKLKERFHNSIDQKWSETIWKIVYNSAHRNKNTDLAFEVDTCFMRLINFITDVLAYKEGIIVTDITSATKEIKQIYQQEKNILFLFNVLNCIDTLESANTDFWHPLFYIDKTHFSKEKTRLFFQNSQVNLLEKCLFTYSKNSREFPFPEQLLLYACITQWLNNTENFDRAARIVRNLVANSSNELRVESIGDNFREIENFVLHRDFNTLVHFKTDQINEEGEKQEIITKHTELAEQIYALEDSDLFRGCISIFDIEDKNFIPRKNAFLNLFDEDVIITDFSTRANLLLCFGDYSQDDGDYTNVLARSKANWRTFLTTPAFSKAQLNSKTKPILTNCLEHFIANPGASAKEIIDTSLQQYESKEKDWKYYFLRYKGFREQCNKGYYYWDENNPYPLFKMKEKQFNGYHWDPFLLEVKKTLNTASLQLDNGDQMQMIINDNIYQISSNATGFTISKVAAAASDEILEKQLEITIKQSDAGIDLEDRVERLMEEVSILIS